MLHPDINNDKFLVLFRLDEENRSPKAARLAHQGPSRLNNQTVGRAREARGGFPGEAVEIETRLVHIADPVAAPQVKGFDFNPLGAEAFPNAQDFVQRPPKRLDFPDLRADVTG